MSCADRQRITRSAVKSSPILNWHIEKPLKLFLWLFPGTEAGFAARISRSRNEFEKHDI
jgi:hypothetical protein